MMGERPNDFPLSEHFRLYEFANGEGLVTVHPSLIRSAEAVRAELCQLKGEEVAIIVTSGTRTRADNAALGARFGWLDNGGPVSRHSKHLPGHGGIAMDFYAKVVRVGDRIPQRAVGEAARNHFDWVRDDYEDGHVHADNRDGGLKNPKGALQCL